MDQGHEPSYDVFRLGDVVLRSGGVLPDARLAYKTYGRLNTAKDNVVVVPTHYTGKHSNNEPYFGAGTALDPETFFVVVPNLFGNGLSSSPSNTPPPFDGPRFPKVTLYDNIAFQHRLLTEVFGVERVAMVTGWSMGAMQAYQWAAQYPNMVACILPFCGSAYDLIGHRWQLISKSHPSLNPLKPVYREPSQQFGVEPQEQIPRK